MSLASLLDTQGRNKKANEEITAETLDAHLDEIREQIAFYREYPDLFVDDMSGYSEYCREHGNDEGWKGFKFYYYQRIFIRTAMRYRKTYYTFSRGFSKSFLSMLVLMLKAILYPNSELFITTGGKARMAACAAV